MQKANPGGLAFCILFRLVPLTGIELVTFALRNRKNTDLSALKGMQQEHKNPFKS